MASQGVKLTSDLHVVPRLINGGFIPPFPLYALLAWTRATFPFKGGGACFMVRDAVVVTLTVYQLDTMGPTDRPTDRPTGRPAVLPAHTVWLRAVFGKNKDRRCSSFDPSERN